MGTRGSQLQNLTIVMNTRASAANKRGGNKKYVANKMINNSPLRRATTNYPPGHRRSSSSKPTSLITTTRKSRRPTAAARRSKKPPAPVTVLPQFPVQLLPDHNKINNSALLLGVAFLMTTPAVISRNFSTLKRVTTGTGSSLLLNMTSANTLSWPFSSLAPSSEDYDVQPHEDYEDLHDHEAMGAIHHTSSLHEYLFPLLVLFPVITVIGNALVVLLCSIMVFQAITGRSGSRGESISSSDSVRRRFSWSRGSVVQHGRTATSTATNFYLISLASADLLIGAYVMPFALYLEWTDGRWGLGTLACDLWLTIDNLATTASILSLAAIAQNRYLAIARPVTYSNLQRKRRLIFIGIPIAIVWLISAAVAAPIVFGLNNVPDRKSRFCKLYRVEYLMYTSVVSFFIPSIAIGLQYVAVFRALGERARRMMMRRVSVVMSRIAHRGSVAGSNTESTARISDVVPPGGLTVRFDMRPSFTPICENVVETNGQNVAIVNIGNQEELNGAVLNDMSTMRRNNYFDPLTNASPRIVESPHLSPHRRKSEPFFHFAYRQNMLKKLNKEMIMARIESFDEEDEEEETSLSPVAINNNGGVANKFRPRLTSFSSLTSLSSLRTSSTIGASNNHRFSPTIAPPCSKRESETGDDWLLTINESNYLKQRRISVQSETKTNGSIETRQSANNIDNKQTNERRSSECPSSNRLAYSASMNNLSKQSRKKHKLRRGVKRKDSKVTRERRATIMLSVVLVLFYCCWLPYFLATVSKSVCAHFDSRSRVEQVENAQCVPDIVMHVLAWLGHANSMANPFVYAVFNPEFRAAFWRIFGNRIVYRFSSFWSSLTNKPTSS